MEDKKQIFFSISVGIAAILIIWVFTYFNNKERVVQIPGTATSTVAVGDGKLDSFAKCLAEKDLTMYGAVWCSHCLTQKKLFGSSFQFAKYVECPDNIKLCTDKGINGFPTWMDAAGKKYEGEQSLATLAKISGCELPQ